MVLKIDKIFLNIIKIASAGLLLLPLFVYSKVLYPYVFPKIIVFQIIVEAIFLIWLALVLYSKDREKYKINWRNPLVICLSLFMGTLFITAFLGTDIRKSFWSSQERMIGVSTILHFYAWFLILISCFKRQNNYKFLIWINLICSFLIGLYGLGQKIGLKFLLQGEVMRMSATLGNPVFLSSYALLNFFLGVFLFLKTKRKLFRWIALGLGLFNLTVMMFTAARSSLIALIAVVFVFAFYLVFRRQTRKSFKIILIISLLFIVLAGIVLKIPLLEKWVNKAPLVVRRLSQTNIEGSQSRLYSWQAGLQGFKEKPIFGWGRENFNLVFNEYYQPWYLSKSLDATWFDRSHNQVIDVMALSGIFGLIAYLGIYFSVFYLLFKKYKKLNNQNNQDNQDNQREKISLVILGLMFLAYFIQNLFVFDTPAPLIVFYFSLGLVYFITRDKYSNTQDQAINQEKFKFKIPLPVIIILMIILFPWIMYKINIEPWQQSRLAVKAIGISKTDLALGLTYYQKSLSKPVFTNPETRAQLAKTVSEYHDQLAKGKNMDLNILQQATDLAIQEYQKNTQEHPLDARYWLYLAQLYTLGAKYQPDYLDQGIEALGEALELSPKRQQIYFELARIYLYQNKHELAIKTAQEAVGLDDRIGQSHWNLGLMYLFSGNEEMATQSIEKAMFDLPSGWRYYQPGADIELAKAFLSQGDNSSAINLCARVFYWSPDDMRLQVECILIYAKSQRITLARTQIEKIAEKSPEAAAEARYLLEEYLSSKK